ncbi:Crp/Fnr family transcriptional regulator [Cupriavidus basilensis]|uniref:Transcriptional regulator, Crp/Fnr family n=1 Tax=Cupriavidus basilensis TaxID=68895 RepID=A0A0C4YAK9_9BURK|nr:Crp/Fnr family transcriptional regulator [Cupriavidus basilensis]AJG22532.1 transcriptional regulator, Crp/Fnr family [Cupriavidus basilensis]
MQTLSNPHRERSVTPEFLLRTRSSRSASLESFVESATWFAGLTAEEQARVQADAYERQYPAGGVACHRGDPADHWLAVIEGMAKVDTASACGRAITFAGVPAGSWFGEGAVLKREPRPYSVVAIKESRVAFVPRATFLWLLDRNPAFSRYVIDQLNARCGYYVGLVHNLRLHEAAARVAFCLAELFHQQLYPSTDRTLSLSQEEVGRLSGLSRQNTNRALRELADAGMLAIEYGSIQILDLEGMRQFAHIGD